MLERIISRIILPITLTVVFSGCGKDESAPKEPPVEENSATIVKLSQVSINESGLKTEIISRKTFSQFITVPAKVLTNQDNEAQVGSLVQGRVCKVFVKIGDNVKAGQELMLVEGLEIGDIKAGFLSAKANLEYQKLNYERQKKLTEENVGAQKNFLETQKEYEKALAEFGAEENRINAIGLSESDVVSGIGSSDSRCSGGLSVKSPISGIVVERNVVIGQLIEGSTNAFKIINLSSVWVDGQIYEKDIGKLNNKSTATFISASYPDESFTGKISYIGQMIDEKTRTITVRAEFNNASGKLKPQMYGELKIPNEKNTSALLVPAEALVKFDNSDFVFIQKEDSSFSKRPVIVGIAQNELIEITSGIQDGECVVVKGAFSLKSEFLKSLIGGE